MSRFYAITYPIRFEDTMAYGSHHFLTNFRFQCAVRESLFFDYFAEKYPGDRSEYDDLVILTRDGYTRNLAPAMLGERVAVLLSLAQSTRSSIQLCIRTINAEGEPVAAGFQTLVFMNRKGELVPYPRALDLFSGMNLEVGERLVEPAFAAAIMGGTREFAAVFPDEVRALGKRIARERRDGGSLVEVERPATVAPKFTGNTVFSFPGQGAFEPKLFRELSRDASAQDLLSAAEPVAQQTLGVSLRRLVGASDEEGAQLLAASPDLDQFGIILTELMLARRLAARGIVPDAVIGHSFGEIAALCVAGCFTPEVALRVVAERVRALRQVTGPVGGMMALTVPLMRAKEVLAEVDTGGALTVSVVNDPRQTVVSGPRDYLEQLVPEFAKRRIGARVLASRHAFHSPGLASAARALVMGLIPLPFGAPRIAAYSPIVGRFYDNADALQIALSSHLTRPVDFPHAMQALVASGMTRIIECGAGGVLTAIVRRNELNQVEALSATDALAGPAAPPVQKPAAVDKRLEPIAIVSMGAVLPGAKDIEAFWSNLIDGTSGIVDLRTVDPVVGADLIGGAQTAVIADKSYSALAGYAADVPWRQEYPFTTGAFAAMSKAQRLLAEALRQARLPGSDKHADRTLCLLGSTADGIAEYDDALHGAVARHVLDGLNLPAALRTATRQALDKLLPPGDPEAAGPYPAMSSIVGPMLGEGVRTVMLDAACASSLYALDLGVQALRAGEADLVYAGGVFAPGPSGSALFSQFGGLSTTGSHALDKNADGVVFGEGAAILVLRRLSDAVARGETIHAVVTASALSSDGHSVAINVPRAEGQRKAMEAAYRASGIDPQSVQCVEAHATATPVGDATEFKALTSVYGGRDPSLPRIKLGSVKSLLGHTGWLAGAASVIKVIESMKRGILPPHHGWTAPGAGIDLAESPFDIVTQQQPWPDRPGVPRRAAINGFGFGGTNAHVVIEAFDPAQAVAARPVAPPDVVCVGFGAAFPGGGDSFADRASGRAASINTAPFRLPRRKLLMPDALEQMDTAQFTVLASADRALDSAKLDLAKWKERTGIVIGSAGKARRGVAAIQRVLADRLHRKLSAALVEAGQDAQSTAMVCDALAAKLKAAGGKPSNAYTLVGMMPNLVAGRASNVFDFSGPSVVVDTGPQSLIDAMRVAQSYLNHHVCDVILAGGVNTTAPWPRAGLPAGDDGGEPDGATLLVLMRRETAVANNLPILASVAASGDELSIVPAAGGEAKQTDIPAGRPHEVGGVAALAECLHAGSPQRFRWNRRNDAAAAAQMGYLRDPRPISFYERVAAPAPIAASGELPRRILLVTDQPALADKLQRLPMFARSRIRCLVPSGNDEKTVAAIDANDIDLLLVARDLTDVAPSAMLDLKVEPTVVLDLAFLAVRHLHEQIEEGRVKLLALNLGAWPNGMLHPDAALLHGMLKSLARDWPAATVRALATESSDLAAAAAAVGRELACAESDVEIVESGGQRHALRFARATLPPDSEAVPIDKRSVVVLTGGARGVTAVMAEALLKQYGCRLVLLGRSDPTIVPAALQSLSLDDMDRYETEYYRSERQANPKRTIPELKRAFARLKAAHETWVTTEQLRRLGSVEFKTIDITDPQQLDTAIADIVKRHGSVDLVVHGAGLQISKRLSSRQLGEFQAVVGTKLNGLRNLVASCARHAGPDVPFHILTSAFSALGNDGQPDYGAANEAMAALANVHPRRGRWTALGWLGWAAVGMTRGSEYAALGNSRGLRAVLPEEGKALFLELLQSKGGSPAVSLLSEGEIQFYKLPVAETPPAPAIAREPEQAVVEFPLSVESAPYLDDHKVNGVPVLPGTFEVEFALRAARTLRPNHPYLAARNPRFHRFVRVSERGTSLRVEARVLEDRAESSVVGIRLLSDFVHRSGVVLQPDVLHFEGEVLTSTRPFAHMVSGDAALDFSAALPCVDPYLAAGSPVKLGGMFACLHDIRIGPQARTARYQVSPDKSLDSLQGFISPVLLLDALFRLVGVAPDGDVTTGEVSVPLRGDTFHFTAGVTDRVLHGTPLRMVAVNPRIDGEYVATDWGHVVDAEGRILVSIAGAYARRMGTPTALAAS